MASDPEGQRILTDDIRPVMHVNNYKYRPFKPSRATADSLHSSLKATFISLSFRFSITHELRIIVKVILPSHAIQSTGVTVNILADG